MDNCLTYALRVYRYRHSDNSFTFRVSNWGWFPHFSVFFEMADGSLIKKEYVPIKPRPRFLPPLFFKGVEKTTIYKRTEVIDARQSD